MMIMIMIMMMMMMIIIIIIIIITVELKNIRKKKAGLAEIFAYSLYFQSCYRLALSLLK
jgi:hypothetical protein